MCAVVAGTLPNCMRVIYVCVYSVPPHSCYEIASLGRSFVTVLGVFYYAALLLSAPKCVLIWQGEPLVIITKSSAPLLYTCHDIHIMTEFAWFKFCNRCMSPQAPHHIWHTITNRGNFPILRI